MTTKQDFDSIRRAVLRSISQLQERDHSLLKDGANERSISHKLGCYLSRELPDWGVDCEYNRDHHDERVLAKKLGIRAQSIRSDDTSGTTVYPDIVVHQRGTNDNNWLVVEIKKDANEQGAQQDKAKLEKFVEQLHYKYGLFINFQTGRNTRNGELDWLRGDHWIRESFPKVFEGGNISPQL